MKKELSVKKTILNICLFLALTVIAMYALLHGQDLAKIIEAIKTASPIYLLLGSFLGFAFIACETINIHTLLKALDYKIPFRQSLKYALTGFFFSSITPSATGGQPMQLYAMKRDNIELSHGSLALLLELACFQITTLSLGVISLVWALNSSLELPSYIMLLVVVGLLFNGVVLIFIVFGIFSEIFSQKLLNFITYIINKLPFLSSLKKEECTNSFKEQIKEYHRCSRLIQENLTILLKVIPILFLQFGCQFSVSYMIYLALGQHSVSYIEIVMLQTLVYTATAFVPLPGSVGINEGIFLKVFQGVYTVGLTSSAMLLSRGISFYLCLIVSGVVLMAIQIRKMVKQKNIKDS